MDSDVGGEEGGQNERNHTLGLLSFMLDGLGGIAEETKWCINKYKRRACLGA